MSDSEVQQLIIWVGTQSKINQAREQGLIGYDDFTCVTDMPEFALQSEVQAIQVLIPSAATSQNQLADKAFVNSSINNMAAFYITSNAQGDPFANRTALIAGPWYMKGELRTPTQNDYALVTEDETHDDYTSRYMYDGSQWVWQYTLNNSKFTQQQLDAINSGITSSLVTQIGTNETSIGDLTSLTTTTKTDLVSAINELQGGKQATLLSGTNIKTVNNNSLLGSGNVDIDALPSQSGQSGKYLTTNGTTASWGSIDFSNYVTLNTVQTISAAKFIVGTDYGEGAQKNIFAALSTESSSAAVWKGRMMVGAKDLTFLMGTYGGMAGLGAHSWTDSATATGATWADFYLNPDGAKTVYIGGYGWKINSGWFRVQNTGSISNGKIQVNMGDINTPNWKDVAYKGENLSDFNDDVGFVKSVNNITPVNGNVTLNAATFVDWVD